MIRQLGEVWWAGWVFLLALTCSVLLLGVWNIPPACSDMWARSRCHSSCALALERLRLEVSVSESTRSREDATQPRRWIWGWDSLSEDTGHKDNSTSTSLKLGFGFISWPSRTGDGYRGFYAAFSSLGLTAAQETWKWRCVSGGPGWSFRVEMGI